MESFVGEPVVPVLTFAEGFGPLTGVTQGRFFLSPDVTKAHAQTYKPECDKLGMPTANDTAEKRALRAELFEALGEANDPSLIAIARHLTELYLANPNSIGPSLVRPATASPLTTATRLCSNKSRDLPRQRPIQPRRLMGLACWLAFTSWP